MMHARGMVALVILSASGTACRQRSDSSVSPMSVDSTVIVTEERETGDIVRAPARMGLRAVDINSRLRVEFDHERIARRLQPPSACGSAFETLAQRARQLAEARRAVPRLIALTEEAHVAWAAAEREGDSASSARSLDAIKAMSALEDDVIEALREAVESRLTAAGDTAETSDVGAGALIQSLRRPGGWDLAGYRAAAQAEIDHLTAGMRATVQRCELQVAVEAQRWGKDGTVQIAIPGFNDVEQGTDQGFTKIGLGGDPAAAKAVEATQALQATDAEQDEADRSLQARMRSALGGRELDVRTGALGTFVGAAAAWKALATLVSDAETKRQLAAATAAQPTVLARQQVNVAIADADSTLKDVANDIDALAALTTGLRRVPNTVSAAATAALVANVRHTTSALGAEASLRAVDASVWRARFEKVRALGVAMTQLTATGADPSGQTGQVKAVQTALQGLVRSLDDGLPAITDGLALADVVVRGALQLADGDATEPTPIESIPVDLSIAAPVINLRTIREGIAPDDHVTVRIRFQRGGAPVGTPIDSRFVVQSQGWNATTIAGLAWIVRERESTFSPTASISVMLHQRPWSSALRPEPRQSRLLSLGLSTMTLAFDDTDEVEFGLAPTIGFFSSRLLIGGGLNLQTTESRYFGFLSVRLFSASGALGVEP